MSSRIEEAPDIQVIISKKSKGGASEIITYKPLSQIEREVRRLVDQGEITPQRAYDLMVLCDAVRLAEDLPKEEKFNVHSNLATQMGLTPRPAPRPLYTSRKDVSPA